MPRTKSETKLPQRSPCAGGAQSALDPSVFPRSGAILLQPPVCGTDRRRLAGLTQAQLGDALGVHRVTVAKIEAGLREPPAVLCERWAEVCGVDAGTLAAA